MQKLWNEETPPVNFFGKVTSFEVTRVKIRIEFMVDIIGKIRLEQKKMSTISKLVPHLNVFNQ